MSVLNPSDHAPVPVIDLFAGPGGLGEGFSRCISAGEPRFSIRLSIEKDQFAHQTLLLRSFFRQFPCGSVPADYYSYLRGAIDRDELFRRHPDQAAAAEKEAWHAELGSEETPDSVVDERIREALGDAGSTWVLVGGPPCQAYSIAGRSRRLGAANRIEDEQEREKKVQEFYSDGRHVLYREYLRIIAVHRPALFVMENVRGMLSSRHNGARIFDRIEKDLRAPREALLHEKVSATDSQLRYHLFPMAPRTPRMDGTASQPSDYLVRSEEHGIPQARHRVLLIGVRSDVFEQLGVPPALGPAQKRVRIEEVIGDLPHLRGQLSRRSGGADTFERWKKNLMSARDQPWFSELPGAVAREILGILGSIDHMNVVHDNWIACRSTAVQYRADWYHDRELKGVCNHYSRSHKPDDFWRYLFASVFASVEGRSPVISDFPSGLLPEHSSARQGGVFADRFRVQLRGRPSTTVVAHISKDGHYYIHYDPSQCRSLSIREAARLQTFPDNYYFEGPRTAQYQQVGNAVPPLLAAQVAEKVYEYLGPILQEVAGAGSESSAGDGLCGAPADSFSVSSHSSAGT